MPRTVKTNILCIAAILVGGILFKTSKSGGFSPQWLNYFCYFFGVTLLFGGVSILSYTLKRSKKVNDPF